MYSPTLLALVLSLTTNSVLAMPAASPAPDPNPFSYLPLTFKFYTGLDFYQDVSFVADGQYYLTNLTYPVTSIDGNGFDPYYTCNFDGPSEGTLKNYGDGTIGVEPEQPIYRVACEPTPQPPATCLPVYASCQWDSKQGGSFQLPCCSGYCAATKCRAT